MIVADFRLVMELVSYSTVSLTSSQFTCTREKMTYFSSISPNRQAMAFRMSSDSNYRRGAHRRSEDVASVTRWSWADGWGDGAPAFLCRVHTTPDADDVSRI